MKKNKLILPSNFKFGITFSIIFICLFVYFFIKEHNNLSFFFLLISIIFLCVSYIKNELLLPLNKGWMYIGYLIGKIISPIVLGLLFFIIITPIALVMRIIKRDELLLKNDKNKNSYWVLRKNNSIKNSFYNQF